MIKMTCKRKWMSWLSYTSQWRKNLKQHHIQNQSKFLPWYLINGLKCTVQNILNIIEYFVSISHEIIKEDQILGKPAPKKGKAITIETLHLVTKVFEDDNFSK